MSEGDGILLKMWRVGKCMLLG